MHGEALQQLRSEADWPTVRPAFTCDMWQSATQREYLTVTAQWIDVDAARQTPVWSMRMRVVATQQVDGDDDDKVSAAGELRGGMAYIM